MNDLEKSKLNLLIFFSWDLGVHFIKFRTLLFLLGGNRKEGEEALSKSSSGKKPAHEPKMLKQIFIQQFTFLFNMFFNKKFCLKKNV